MPALFVSKRRFRQENRPETDKTLPKSPLFPSVRPFGTVIAKLIESKRKTTQLAYVNNNIIRKYPEARGENR